MCQNGKGMGNGQSVHLLIYDSHVVCFGDRLYECTECTLGLCMTVREPVLPLLLQANVNTYTALVWF